jgi:type VI secretion system secreted protein Hcp
VAVHMFIKIDDITGEATDAQHKDQIEVLSWGWGMTQSGSAHTSSGTGTGQVSVADLSFSKYVDKSTPTLIKYCCKGTFYKKATLYVLKAGNNPLEYLTIDMTDGLISGIDTGQIGPDERLVETVRLNFKAFKLIYTPQKDGKPAAGVPAGWDIARNTET